MFVGIGVRIKPYVSSVPFSQLQWQLILTQWQDINETWNL
jgi:hypothetical protein